MLARDVWKEMQQTLRMTSELEELSGGWQLVVQPGEAHRAATALIQVVCQASQQVWKLEVIHGRTILYLRGDRQLFVFAHGLLIGGEDAAAADVAK